MSIYSTKVIILDKCPCVQWLSTYLVESPLIRWMQLYTINIRLLSERPLTRWWMPFCIMNVLLFGNILPLCQMQMPTYLANILVCDECLLFCETLPIWWMPLYMMSVCMFNKSPPGECPSKQQMSTYTAKTHIYDE